MADFIYRYLAMIGVFCVFVASLELFMFLLDRILVHMGTSRKIIQGYATYLRTRQKGKTNDRSDE